MLASFSINKHKDNNFIILWGGALYGEIAYKVITQIYGFRIAAIVDNKYRELSWLSDNIPVIRSEQINEYMPCEVVVCAATSFSQIQTTIEKMKGEVSAFDCRKILVDYIKAVDTEKIVLDNGYVYGEISLKDLCEKYDFYAGVQNGYDKKISLGYCVLCITTKCTLRCKECAAFINDYKDHRDYDIDFLQSTFGRFLDAIDIIEELELMGGEPFCHYHIDDILKWCIQNPKINAVKIITNGSIMPKESTWRILQDHKIKLVIDDYGDKSKKYSEILEMAKKSHVNYEEQKLQTWNRVKPIEKKGRNGEEISKIYKNCPFRNCIGITNGRLYHCNVAGHMYTLSMIPDSREDYVEIEKSSLNEVELREEIRKYLKLDYLKACYYCGVSDCVEAPVAEQL